MAGWVVTGGHDPEQTLAPAAAVFRCGQAISSVKVWPFTPQGQWSANLKGSRLFLLQTEGRGSASQGCIILKQGHPLTDCRTVVFGRYFVAT